MIVLWHWCGSMHGCACLNPSKVLVFFIIHICQHLLGCYWIKFPLFQLFGFWLPTYSWSIWAVYRQVPHYESLLKTKISESQKCFIVTLYKVCSICKPFTHQPVLVYTINSTHMFLVCNNIIWAFNCDLITTLFLSTLLNTFSHFSTNNFNVLLSFYIL